MPCRLLSPGCINALSAAPSLPPSPVCPGGIERGDACGDRVLKLPGGNIGALARRPSNEISPCSGVTARIVVCATPGRRLARTPLARGDTVGVKELGSPLSMDRCPALCCRRCGCESPCGKGSSSSLTRVPVSVLGARSLISTGNRFSQPCVGHSYVAPHKV
jgi:hypothetical protein